MRPVKIHIVSLASSEEGTHPSEYTCFGRMTEKDGKRYVFYEEKAEGLEGVKTTLKWDEEQVVLLRSGALDHRQEFRKGLKHLSLYKTPYLKIPLETETSYLYTYSRDGVWHIELHYTLAQDRQPYGKMKILIDIEEHQDGH
ncbi:MAG: DUF1934 domain-containing protein [Phascolarctobacterium sp.]|nr:DUF1934 domain-containing protein [Phascolarctobacterium sp.]